MQALSGFKQVYSGMSRFLMEPSSQTYDAARATLTTQIGDLKVMAEAMRPTTDVADSTRPSASPPRCSRISIVSGACSRTASGPLPISPPRRKR